MTPPLRFPSRAAETVASVTQQVRVRMRRRSRRIRWERVIDRTLRDITLACFGAALGLVLWAGYVTAAAVGVPGPALAMGLAILAATAWRRSR